MKTGQEAQEKEDFIMEAGKKVLDFKAFLKEVTGEIRERLGDGYRIEEMQRDDLNNTVKHSLLVARYGEAVQPCINMDVCYQYYRKGEDVAAVVDGIIKGLQEDVYVKDAGVFDFSDWGSVKSRLHGRLVNTEKNKTFLQEVPNREYLDLSIVYYIRVAEVTEGNYYGMQIRNEHMLMWNVDEDMLYREFVKNMDCADDVLFEDLFVLLAQLLQMNEKLACAEIEIGKYPASYILGSRSKINGAIQMCNHKALRDVAEYIKDDFWILPCSIHEVLVLPCHCTEDDAWALAQTVREVNDGEIALNEILSYHVYRYERETGEVRIAA